MADGTLDQRVSRIEARLEGIETELLKLTELVTDNLAESRAMREDIRNLGDQFFVQGGMSMSLQMQIQRLERRVRALEEKRD